jgi:hypothetical protein
LRKLLLLLVLSLAPPLPAANTPLRTFDTVLGIQRDGSVVVVEKFIVASDAPSLKWSTSTEYRGKWSVHTPRVVTILQVTGLDGTPLKYSLERGLSRLTLAIDSASRRDFRIVYSVRNAVEFLHDRDELLWDAGEGWRGAAESASVYVQVPPEVQSVFRAQAHLGGHGVLPLKQTDVGPDRVWFEAPYPLEVRDRLLVGVVLPKGILHEPSLGQRCFWFLGANSIVLLPLATLAAMFLLRELKRLPEPPETSIVPRYEPPEQMTPAEVGVLLDGRLDPRDVTATLLDLAVRGYIRLERCKPDAGVLFDHPDFAIRCLRPREEWAGLQLHERTLLFNTFYGGNWTKLSSLALRFYSTVPTIKLQVLDLLKRKRLYWTDPSYAPAARLAMLGAFLLIALVIQVIGVFSFASSWLLSLLAIATSAAIVYYFGRTITAKTLRGLACHREVLGFQDFLNSVERDRLERLPEQLFEKWLPYAMALGVEHHWAEHFEDIAIPPPEWLEGLEDAAFSAGDLVHLLANFERESLVTLFSSPRAAAARA